MENSEKANAVFERWIERMKTEGIPNPLGCFKDVPIKNLSMLDIANFKAYRQQFSQTIGM